MKHILFCVLVALGISFSAYAQEPDAPASSPCELPALIEKARELLADTHATHSEKREVFYETLREQNGETRQKKEVDYLTREIPAVLLNTTTCELCAVTITRRIENRKAILESANGSQFTFDIEERVYGKIWNEWNTPYIVTPRDWVVIFNKWKTTDGNEITYVPFSNSLRNSFPNIPLIGQAHYDNDIEIASQDLLGKQVLSKTFPGLNAGEVIRASFLDDLRLIPLAEQTDPMESYAYRIGQIEDNPFERVQFIIGTNGNHAYHFTQSGVGAKNLMQIWPPTCKIIRKQYPSANIFSNCNGGTNGEHGHIDAINTAILLYDANLFQFIAFEKTGFLGPFTRAFIRKMSYEKSIFFTKNLGNGMRDDEVRTLQRFLNQNGFLVAKDGPGSQDNETNFFGSRTQNALARFQKEHETEIFSISSLTETDVAKELGRELFAAYNGGIGRVTGALKAYGNEWDRLHYTNKRRRLVIASASLRQETVSYLDKFDFLKENFGVIVFDSQK